MTHSLRRIPDSSSSACHVSAAQLVELCWLWQLVLPASLEEWGRYAGLPGEGKSLAGSLKQQTWAKSLLTPTLCQGSSS